MNNSSNGDDVKTSLRRSRRRTAASGSDRDLSYYPPELWANRVDAARTLKVRLEVFDWMCLNEMIRKPMLIGNELLWYRHDLAKSIFITSGPLIERKEAACLLCVTPVTFDDMVASDAILAPIIRNGRALWRRADIQKLFSKRDGSQSP